MVDDTKRQIERFEADYERYASKNIWEPCDITLMKDLQKLMYYLEVRQKMKEGAGYPDSDYMDEEEDFGSGRSFARRRNRMGQFTSGRSGRSGRSGGSGGPWYYDDGRGSGRNYYEGGRGSGDNSYESGRGSGRRYYDGQKEEAIHKMEKMLEMENNPEVKMAIEEGLRFLESK